MDLEKQDFYANSIHVVTGLYDVTLYFRVQTPVLVEQGQDPMVESVESKEACTVRMSPQLAKSTAALLLKHISDYEKNTSVNLPLPSDIEEIWSEYCK